MKAKVSSRINLDFPGTLPLYFDTCLRLYNGDTKAMEGVFPFITQ